MNTIGDRIKQLRESLGMSAKDFGGQIGIGNSSVSKIEKGVNGTTDQTIRSICREFHVREEWLREGTGEMYDEGAEDNVDLFLHAHNVSGLEADLFKAYFSMPEDLRRAFLEYFTRYFDVKDAQQHSSGEPPNVKTEGSDNERK